jgi:hypothetical protein
MRRNGILWGAIVALTLLAAVEARAATLSQPLDADTMKAALQAGTPEASKFIDHVVAMVNKGRLPLDLVESTFLWARKKPRHKFFYFREALIRRAAAIGITI